MSYLSTALTTELDPLPTMEQKLYWLTQEVLGNWAFLPADPGYFSEGNEALPLQYMSQIHGPQDLTVVVRGPMATGVLLAESATGEAADEAEARDAFRELANLLSGHLLTELVGKLSGQFQPFIPHICTKGEWPPSRPDASCAVSIEGNHLEIHFWSLP